MVSLYHLARFTFHLNVPHLADSEHKLGFLDSEFDRVMGFLDNEFKRMSYVYVFRC